MHVADHRVARLAARKTRRCSFFLVDPLVADALSWQMMHPTSSGMAPFIDRVLLGQRYGVCTGASVRSSTRPVLCRRHETRHSTTSQRRSRPRGHRAPGCVCACQVTLLDRNSVSHDRNSVSCDRKSVSHDLNSVSHNLNSVSHDLNSVSNDLNSVSHDLNSVSYDRNSVSYDHHSVSHDLNSVSYDRHSVSHDLNSVPTISTLYPRSQLRIIRSVSRASVGRGGLSCKGGWS
jgi:hypothetical protein